MNLVVEIRYEFSMDDPADANEDPAVVGVPPETPEQVRPSATGLVVGPVDDDIDVVSSDSPADEPGAALAASPPQSETSDDQMIEDATGAVHGSLLDAPDAPDAPGPAPS